MPLFRDLIAAHLLQFERPVRGSLDAATGTRLVIAFVLVGLTLHPALRALTRAAGVAHEPWAMPAIVVTLLVAVIVVMTGLVRTGWETIGLYGWKRWTPRERIYLLTVAPLAAVAFAIIFRGHFERLAGAQGWPHVLLVSVPTGLLWGIVQELIYRGLLQTELVRRLGAVPGVLLTNLVFTLGPLHFYHFRPGADAGPRWDMLAAIFGIGLIFSVLYRRSGNLWIPAVLHGIWPLNVT
jgi:membrane protease YdiL (CAAX protease family)